MFTIRQDFWSDVAWGSTERGGKRFLSDDFGQAKVSKLDIGFFVYEQDVLWLDIPVDNIAIMLFRVSTGWIEEGG